MCDYSLTNVKSRDAEVGDKLVVRNFGTGTLGFAPQDSVDNTAVCVRPGTEIGFDEAIKVTSTGLFPWWEKAKPSSVAIFRQVNKDLAYAHHDALELPNGEVILLTLLSEGQKAHVLQLPAEPKTEQERTDQTRVAHVERTFDAVY